jgi:tRNA1Val (adenine37-N6)-methyltransferase
MSSINSFFTFSYLQPDEYHFSHDSVFLARRVFEILQKENIQTQNILDLCAGCGVIGLDFLFHLRQSGQALPERADFLEVQPVYHKFFAANVAQIPELKRYEFLTMNYQDVQNHSDLNSKYDLILCNPPYFKKEMGALSPSDFKNRCRFFLDSDLDNLFLAIQYLLKSNGKAFVLLKDLTANGFSMEAELQRATPHLQFTKIEKIRETDLYLIQKA